MKIIEKPHIIFLLSIPILIIIGILNRDTVLDINVHDTYYVISYLYLAIPVAIFFGIIGLGYWIMQKIDRKLSKWLNGMHVGLTFGGTMIVLILTQFFRTQPIEYEFNQYLNLTIWSIVLLIILGQLIFPINIICGLTEKKNKDSS